MATTNRLGKNNKKKQKPYQKPSIIAEEEMVIAFCKICCAFEIPEPKTPS